MTVNIDNDLIRNLTDIKDQELLPTDDLNDLITSAKEKVEDEFDGRTQSIKDQAGMFWACHLVALKMRSASAVKDDGDLKLESPEHYRKEYQAVKEDGAPTSDVAMRAGPK